MFVGHYSAAVLAKAADPRLPLGVLFLAAQLTDIVWAALALAGVEQVRLIPGFTGSNDYDLVYVPYSHSLTATAGWAVLALIVYSVGRNWRGWGGSALLVAAVVLSHWFADLPVHTPDLPLYGDQHKVGYGLWNQPWVTFGLEAGLILGALLLYYRATHARARGGRWNMFVFVLGMLAIQAASIRGPRPQTVLETASVALAVYLGFALVAEWLDRKRVG